MVMYVIPPCGWCGGAGPEHERGSEACEWLRGKFVAHQEWLRMMEDEEM